MTDDPMQRAEIAASLMGVSHDEVKALAAKRARPVRSGRATLVNGRTPPWSWNTSVLARSAPAMPVGRR